MTKCLLFDCDGTLVDSERLGFIGLVTKVSDQGVHLDPDELVTRFRGWELAKIFEVLKTEHPIKFDVNFVPAYRAIVTQLFEKELRPIKDIDYALRNLPQPKAVVSSGPLAKIQQALRVTGLAKYFGENLYSSYEVGVWKPDPEIYNHAARDMGFKNSECVVIDDGLVGVEAGCKAGISTYYYNRYNEESHFPEAISFNSMKDLPALITSPRKV